MITRNGNQDYSIHDYPRVNIFDIQKRLNL